MKKLVIVLILMLLVSCGKEVVIESRGVAPPTATPTVTPHAPHAPLGGVPTWRREDTPERACPIATELLALSRVQGDSMKECLALLHKKNIRLKECIDICVRQ